MRTIPLLLLLILTNTASATSLVRGPYLQSSNQDQVILRWRSDVATDSRAEISLSESGPWTLIQEAGSRTEHALVADNLDPWTRYYYRVGDAAGFGPVHSFRSAPATGQSVPLRLWVLGDVGSGFAQEYAVRDAFQTWNDSQPIDGILLLGDNAYESGLDAEFTDKLFTPLAAAFTEAAVWPAFGNHDGVASNGLTQTGPYFEAFDLPIAGECGGAPSGTEAYYAFDLGDAHFLCIDSHAHDKSPIATMAQWLIADLALPQVQAAAWRIAYFHHPPYSKGSHDSDSEAGMIQMREDLMPILEAGGVDLVLSGHSHGYERSMLLDAHYGFSSSLDPSMILDGGDGASDGVYQKPQSATPHSGTVYVVAGSSGKLASAGDLDHPAMKRSLRLAGSVALDIDGDQLELRFIDSSGQVQDMFTILRTTTTGTSRFSAGLRLLGNPVQAKLQLQWMSDRQRHAALAIYDLRGRLVQSAAAWPLSAGENRLDLDVAELAAGAYFLRFESSDHYIVRRIQIVR